MSTIHPFLQPAIDAAGAVSGAAATAATQKANQAMQIATTMPSRIRAVRIPLPALGAGLLGTLAITWPTPFPSTAYTIATPLVVGSTLLSVMGVTNLTVTGCTVTYKNISLSALLGTAATLHVLAIHDPLT